MLRAKSKSLAALKASLLADTQVSESHEAHPPQQVWLNLIVHHEQWPLISLIWGTSVQTFIYNYCWLIQQGDLGPWMWDRMQAGVWRAR